MEENKLTIMTNKKVLKKYGEYGVPFEVAKKMKCYKYEFSECKNIDEVKKKFNEVSHNDIYIGALVVLEFGNIDIELNSTGRMEERNLLDMIVCIKYLNESINEGEWMTYEFTDTEITSEKQLDNLEEIMYNNLIRFAKEKKLTWSKLN